MLPCVSWNVTATHSSWKCRASSDQLRPRNSATETKDLGSPQGAACGVLPGKAGWIHQHSSGPKNALNGKVLQLICLQNWTQMVENLNWLTFLMGFIISHIVNIQYVSKYMNISLLGNTSHLDSGKITFIQNIHCSISLKFKKLHIGNHFWLWVFQIRNEDLYMLWSMKVWKKWGVSFPNNQEQCNPWLCTRTHTHTHTHTHTQVQITF